MIDEAVIARALAIQGWMSEPELRWLAEQATTHRAIAEIGCWKGRSTIALAAHTPGRVWAIDHWKGQLYNAAAGPSVETAARGAEAIYDEFLSNIEPWRIRVLIWRLPSADAARLIASAGDRFDFVFIDGAHEEVGCAADIEAYRALLTPGGLLAGHDYSADFPGVVKAVDELVGPVERVGDIWWKVL